MGILKWASIKIFYNLDLICFMSNMAVSLSSFVSDLKKLHTIDLNS